MYFKPFFTYFCYYFYWTSALVLWSDFRIYPRAYCLWNTSAAFFLVKFIDFNLAINRAWVALNHYHLCIAEAYLKSRQTSATAIFPEIVNNWKPLTIFAEISILDVWLGFELNWIELLYFIFIKKYIQYLLDHITKYMSN